MSPSLGRSFSSMGGMGSSELLTRQRASISPVRRRAPCAVQEPLSIEDVIEAALVGPVAAMTAIAVRREDLAYLAGEFLAQQLSRP